MAILAITVVLNMIGAAMLVFALFSYFIASIDDPTFMSAAQIWFLLGVGSFLTSYIVSH